MTLCQPLKPKKRLGQVFLKNRRYFKKIIKALDLKPKEVVIEIGPGTGSLTEVLLENKAKVIAVEKDPSFCVFLKKRFKNNPNLKIVEGDIRNILENSEFQETIAKQIPNSNYKIAGNIPYYLTSYLFRLLIDLEKKPKIIVLMVQKEVALRITAQPPKMNLMAVLIQTFFKPKIVCFISKNNFWPKPKVDSGIIKLTLKPEIFLSKNEKEKAIKIIKGGFAHPRKLLLNNLNKNLKIPKEKLRSIFQELKLKENIRAQNLNLSQWLLLNKKIESLD
ncbi:MAG TPA: 16S rRNA (adenine(1518)-N(6)/adenine(1519)-N(6))-dimethyltransferase RsmA [Candidatus Paceibacterota bacterium]|nr:16S rRNA (adenine(1518)-N(6)/adenine(1519)-N(6))-dimethyltransferase RsmA [Candidatus Paceibacterota bacterium]HOK97316.1 16S rRNA (adenine(1518)-N(6)/adenine(1519)-N(6))-dimethyltransferase RsmA [Candidatus Paceibacterota bacterium]HPP64790.1 16S rRNA (adenine(1518)-N(6)/adenine(1519)-N(6))-dimethyltransferase RsmA [Candidatus Paceibacterota bacterium]